MGYFSNGTEGLAWQEKWCHNCVNFKDRGDGRGEGCPVFDLHYLYNYDQLERAKPPIYLHIRRGNLDSKMDMAAETPMAQRTAVMLNELIEHDDETFENKCQMFHGLEGALPGQLPLGQTGWTLTNGGHHQ